jgi:hypothetical protein
VEVAVSVIVETMGASLPPGEMMVSLGADAVSVRVTVAPKVAVCVIVTTFVTEIVEVVVEASQDPLASSWGDATRFSTDPAVARVAMYAKTVMADVANFILMRGIGIHCEEVWVFLSQASEHLCSKRLNECKVKNEMLTEREKNVFGGNEVCVREEKSVNELVPME